MTEEKNEKNEEFVMTTIAAVGYFLAIVGIWGAIGNGFERSSLQKKLNEINPTNAHMEYVNNDRLPDLVYKTGEIYLQTKEGKFISYDEVLQKEKAKIDSVYKSKQDSLKKVFENKLEKKAK